MKKTTKILLGISGICGSVGIILLVAGLILGVSTAQFWDALSLDLGGILNGGSRNEASLEALESLDDISDPSLLPANWRTTSFSGVKSLSLEMDSGAVRMETYDGDEIQVCVQRDDQRTRMEMDGSCLEITQKEPEGLPAGRKSGENIYPGGHFVLRMWTWIWGPRNLKSDGFSAREISAAGRRRRAEYRRTDYCPGKQLGSGHGSAQSGSPGLRNYSAGNRYGNRAGDLAGKPAGLRAGWRSGNGKPGFRGFQRKHAGG